MSKIKDQIVTNITTALAAHYGAYERLVPITHWDRVVEEFIAWVFTYSKLDIFIKDDRLAIREKFDSWFAAYQTAYN